jgi:hypothetical protein
MNLRELLNSWFHRFQSIMGFHCFWAYVVMQNIREGTCDEKQAHFTTDRRQRETNKKGQGTRFVLQSTRPPPTSSNKALIPNSPFSYKLSNGLIH